MIEILNRIKIPWNVSGIAQTMAIKALSSKSHLEKTRNLIVRERKFLKESLSKTRFQYCDSQANFVLIKSRINSKQLQKKLLSKGILVRDCHSFKGLNDKFIRIAIRTHNENQKLVRELSKL